MLCPMLYSFMHYVIVLHDEASDPKHNSIFAPAIVASTLDGAISNVLLINFALTSRQATSNSRLGPRTAVNDPSR